MVMVKKKLKEIFLRVVLQLIQPGGAISMQQGPIDAQSLLIRELIHYSYEKNDLGIAMSIIESVCKLKNVHCSLSAEKLFNFVFFIAYLVHSHISNVEKVYCQRTVDSNSANDVFGSLFATVLRSESARQNTTVSDNSLLVCLLKLSAKLVQTVLPQRDETAAQSSANVSPVQSTSNECQTDETKAEQQQQQEPEPSTSSGARAAPKELCIADTVLQHYPTMNRLLASLSQSSSSSFVLLASSLYPMNPLDTTSAIGDPTTVADAVFQILMLLSRKATQPALVIKPLYDFLKSSKFLHVLM